jgi:ammonia channel protein AmtB
MPCFGFSTYGVSGAKWHYAARAAVQTMMGSFGGGCVGLGYSMFLRDGRLDIMDLINGILGSLVSITGIRGAHVGIGFLLGQSAPTFLMDALFHSCLDGLSHDSRSY